MTKKQARSVYLESTNRGRKYEDCFCLTPNGVRVGYASAKLLATLSAPERRRVAGRVIWASTANKHYSIHSVRPGDQLADVRRHLRLGPGYQVGLNEWHFAPNGPSNALLKVRHGIVEEIGIADKALTRSRHAQLAFAKSFS